jgi:hypothetical protein
MPLIMLFLSAGCGTDLAKQPRDQQLEQVVTDILERVTGVRQHIYVVPDPGNAHIAYARNITSGSRPGRYIAYDPAQIGERTLNDPYTVGILCHEIGHHIYLNIHARFPGGYEGELLADRWAGRCLFTLGFNQGQALSWWTTYASAEPSSSHPAKAERIAAVTQGWNRALAVADERLHALHATITAQETRLAEEMSARAEAEEQVATLQKQVEIARNWRTAGRRMVAVGLFLIVGTFIWWLNTRHQEPSPRLRERTP